MFNKLKLIMACVIVLSICCFGLNTISSNVFADKHEGRNHENEHDDHHKKEKDHSDKRKPADMTNLVHKAQNELLMEKIKAKLEKRMGDKLDKAADLLIDEMLEKYEAKGENAEKRKELREGLKDIFSQEGEPQQ